MGFRHAEAGLAGLACCVLFALSPGEVRAQTTTAKIVYCCDVGGQPVCGDILPAACYGRAYREVSPSGLVRRTVAAPLTPEEIAEQTREYEARFANPFVAASKGFIDEVIMPHSTRRRVARAFASLRGKKLSNPWKKHDNIPL